MQTRNLNLFSLFLFVFIFVNTFSVFAAPSVTTYQAKIIKPDGYPLEASNVNFKFTILDPSGSCILYAETYTAVNMNSTGGLVSFSLGSGVKTYPVSATTFDNIFSNITPSLSCDAGGPVSYSPASTDIRKIVMQFHDGAGWQTLPAMNINAVPYAMYASSAEKLGGVSATAFTQRSEFTTCGAGQALSFNGTGFSCVAINAGTVSAAAITAALGYVPADPASFTTVSSNILSVSSTVFSVSSTVSSLSSAFTSLSNSVAASFAAISGSGISSLNGSTSATQSFAIGVAGNAPAIVTAAGVHTLNIPYASVGTTTAGLISNSEYSLFSTVVSKITSSAAAIAQVLGYTPADQATVTTLSSTVGSVSSAANVAQATANAVSATVNSLASTVTGKITSSSVSIAQVLGYVPAASGGTSSQWVTSGSTINYGLGNVGIGTANPQHKLSVSGSSYFNGRVMFGNTPLENGNFDFGPMIGAGTYTSPFVFQQTMDDFSNNNTFGSMNSIILNSAFHSAGVTAGRFNIVQNSVSSAANHPMILGDYTIADNEGSGNITTLNAQNSVAVNNGAGSIVQIMGISGRAYNANGSVSNMFGAQFGSVNLGGSVTNNYALFIDSAIGAGVTNNYGLYIADQSSVSASQTFNIYSAGSTANNHFAGAVGVGVLLPGARLHVGAGTNMVPGLKLTSSTLTTSPSSGSVEYDGFNLYYTDGTNTRRALATAGSGVTSSSIATALGYTPANSATVSALSTSKITSSAASIAQVLGYVPAASGASGVSSQWTTSSTAIIFTGGNVGIGTSNPSYVLDVSGTSKLSGKVLLGDGAFNNPTLAFANNPGTGLYNASGYLGFSVGSSLIAQLNNSSLQFNAGGAGPQIYFTGGNAAQPSYAFNSDPDTGMYNPGSGGSNELAFSTSGTEKVRITSAGTVGIGTNLPKATLDVRGNFVVGSPGNCWMFNNAVMSHNTLTAPTMLLGAEVECGWVNVTIGGQPTFGPASTKIPTQNIQFYTGPASVGYGTERMRLDYNGNLGIGVTNISAKLHIAAGNSTSAPIKLTSGTLTTVAQSGTIEYNGANLYFTDGTSTRRALATVPSNGTYDTTNVNVSNNLNVSGTTRLAPTVGIGTTSPLFGLHVVADNTNGFAAGFQSHPTSGGVSLGSTGYWGGAIQSLKADGFAGSTSLNPYGGYVGVGTTSPTTVFNVVGTESYNNLLMTSPNYSAVTAQGGSTSGWPIFQLNNQSASSTRSYNIELGRYSNGALEIRDNTAGLPRLTISASGAIGIGTSSPTNTLHVVADPIEYTTGHRAFIAQKLVNNTVSPSSNFVIGAQGLLSVASTNTQNNTSGLSNGGMMGVAAGFSTASGATGTLSHVFALKASVSLNATGLAISNLYGVALGNYGFSGSPTVTNAAGIMAAPVSGATNNTQLLLGQTAIPTGNFGIYNSMSYDNYLQGNTGIGVSAPVAPLDVNFYASAAENIRLRGRNSGLEGGQLTIMDAIGSGGWEVDNYGASGTERLRFFRDKAGENIISEPFAIYPTGNVAIGSHTPTSTLGVFSTNNINSGSNLASGIGAFRINDGSSIGLLFDSNQIEQMDSTNHLYLNFNSSAATIVNGGGGYLGLGLGGTVPGRQFHMGKAINTEFVMEQTDALANYKKWNFVVDSGNATTPSRFYIRQLNDAYSGGNVPFTITASGSIGVNTQTPGGKLEVANNVTMQSNGVNPTFRVTASNSANSDYFQVGWISEDNWAIMTADASTHRNLVVTPWGGNLGVGNTNPTYKLDVSGDIRISGNAYRDGGAAGFTLTSDARLKDVTSSYDRGLKELLDIDTVMFRYKKNTPRNLDTSKEFPGVLAQQVQKVIPEAVDKEKDGFLSLNTTPIFWAMINAIKEVYFEVMGLKSENEQLRAVASEQARKIQSLEEENAAVKARLERIEKALENQNK